MAATGFFYTFTRPRTSGPMSMLKYDPIGKISAANFLGRFNCEDYLRVEESLDEELDVGRKKWHKANTFSLVILVRRKVLFLEQKRKGGS